MFIILCDSRWPCLNTRDTFQRAQTKRKNKEAITHTTRARFLQLLCYCFSCCCYCLSVLLWCCWGIVNKIQSPRTREGQAAATKPSTTPLIFHLCNPTRNRRQKSFHSPLESQLTLAALAKMEMTLFPSLCSRWFVLVFKFDSFISFSARSAASHTKRVSRRSFECP